MNSKHLTSGTFLVILGFLILGRNLGFIPSVPWLHFLYFWPVLLIAAGLQLLFPRGVLALLAPAVLILTTLAVLSGFTPADFTPKWWGEYQPQRIQADSVEPTALLTVKEIPMGTINLQLDETLPGGTIQFVSHSKLTAASYRGNTIGGNRFTLQNISNHGFPRALHTIVSQPLEISVGSHETWQFSFHMGVMTGTLDLSEIQWSKLAVESGISHLILILHQPERNQEIWLNSGLSHLTLHIPKNMNLRIVTETPFFLRGLEKQGFQREQKIYTSPHFSPTLPFVQLHIETGIGTAAVHWL